MIRYCRMCIIRLIYLIKPNYLKSVESATIYTFDITIYTFEAPGQKWNNPAAVIKLDSALSVSKSYRLSIVAKVYNQSN